MDRKIFTARIRKRKKKGDLIINARDTLLAVPRKPPIGMKKFLN